VKKKINGSVAIYCKTIKSIIKLIYNLDKGFL